MVIDDNLLQEARSVLGTKGVRETVEAGLREAVRRHRLEELRRSLGTLELNLTPQQLASLRNEG